MILFFRDESNYRGFRHIILFFRDESNGEKIKALSFLVWILVSGPIFAPRPHMGKVVRMDP